MNQEIEEYTKEDESIIKSFKSQNELSSDIFDDDKKMIDKVRKKLLDISDKFIEYLGVEFFIHDIVLTGSLASYKWSSYSDLDLHVLIDFENTKHGNIELIKEFFGAKKTAWNLYHDITIKNYDVELYVQDVNEEHVSSGVYSILKNKWIIEPEKTNPKIDKKKILDKSDSFIALFDKVISQSEKKDVSNTIDRLLKKLSKFRKSGLEKNGEFSYENLTFKLLRRNGYIQRLFDLKNQSIDKKLSLTQ